MNLSLIPDNDPLLSTKLEPFIFDGSVDTNELAQLMVDYMRASNGIGLSANQVGLPYRMFVMEGEPAYACFNPRIVDVGDENVLLEEGCLTFPRLYVKIKRPKNIKVRFQGPDGETYTQIFSGITARCFQHELDHLNGVSFYSRANTYHREQAFKKWKRRAR